MTSISNKSAHGAALKNSKTKTNKNGYSNCLEAETIEVVPELPFQDDSDAGYSEFSDEFNSAMDEDEPFDEYGEQKPTYKLESNSFFFFLILYRIIIIFHYIVQ